MLDVLVLCARAILVLMALPLLVLSARGFYAYGRGRQTMANCIRAMAFLASLSIVIFTSGIFLFRVPPAPSSLALLMNLLLSMALLITAIVKILRLRGTSPVAIEIVERHMDVAMAIVELDRLDPVAATKIAAECRLEVAQITMGSLRRDG